MRTRAQGTRRAGHARTQHGAACRGQGRPRLPHPRFPRPAAPLRFGRKSRTRQTWARPPARRVIPRARRHTCRCCRALRPSSRQRALKKHMPQPMVRAHIKWLTAAAAQSMRGASSPVHAAYTPMMPLLCRVLQSSGPSRQRALKKHMPQPMVRAHIKWPTAAAERARRASSLRPPHASQPSSRSHRLAEAGCAAADCGASITRTWYGVGVGCAAAAARCASAPVSVPESVACG